MNHGHGSLHPNLIGCGLHTEQVRARPDVEGAADLETLGRMEPQLAGNMGSMGGSFTAHPKIDPETGELFYYG